MEATALLKVLALAEKLKDTTRHCYTSQGRHESVAEHTWMMMLMAFFIQDEFPEADMNKVLRMCLIHDLGEAFTGDIPTFAKGKQDEHQEEALLYQWVDSLPLSYSKSMKALYQEMAERQTLEAKIYKALDGLEALNQHNLSPLETWLPLEFDLNLTYADDKVAFSDYLMTLRQAIRQETLDKIEKGE